MKALVTGASSGIGKDIAIYLSKLGYDLILVAKNKEKLEEVSKEIKTNSKIIVIDLSIEKAVKELCLIAKSEDIDILVNNAGFGSFGFYDEVELSKELEMIDVNIKALHILTKMMLKAMEKKHKTYILNVSSSAGFLPGGPLMSSYYATKSYVTSYTLGLSEELKKKKSNISISVLCPGPVKTNFNDVAGVNFTIDQLESSYVAKYAIDQMFNSKLIIVPGFKMKCAIFFSKFLSKKDLLKISYKIQRKKRG